MKTKIKNINNFNDLLEYIHDKYKKDVYKMIDVYNDISLKNSCKEKSVKKVKEKSLKEMVEYLSKL